MDTRKTQETVTQNLMDAGCGEALIRQFRALAAAGRRRECLTLLARHRGRLLESCHAEQRKIDCLDYLVYQFKHESIQEVFQHGGKTDVDPGMGQDLSQK